MAKNKGKIIVSKECAERLAKLDLIADSQIDTSDAPVLKGAKWVKARPIKKIKIIGARKEGVQRTK